MKLGEIAKTALSSLEHSLQPYGLSPCWEMMVTGLLTHSLCEKGFTIQLPDGKKGDFITFKEGEFNKIRKKRELWLHNSDDPGCTDICVCEPSNAHFEVKTGAFAGSKSHPNHKEIEKDLDRALNVDGYECIIFLLVADPEFYSKLRAKSSHGNLSNDGKERQNSLNSFFPEENVFGKTISRDDAKWGGVNISHLSLRVDLSGGLEVLLNASLRTEYFDYSFDD